MDLNPSNSVVARYIGGPLDDTSEVVSLERGSPPMERRCAPPPPRIGPEIQDENEPVPPMLIGIYWFKGGTQAPDFEGLPGAKRWVDATYEWRGWR